MQGCGIVLSDRDLASEGAASRETTPSHRSGGSIPTDLDVWKSSENGSLLHAPPLFSGRRSIEWPRARLSPAHASWRAPSPFQRPHPLGDPSPAPSPPPRSASVWPGALPGPAALSAVSEEPAPFAMPPMPPRRQNVLETLLRRVQDNAGARSHLIAALELEALLGVGSMGTVYSAFLMGQRIVCKVIEHSPSAIARTRNRSERAALEATIAHVLTHPNIVTTYATFSGAVPVARLSLRGTPGHRVPVSQTRDATLLLQELCTSGTLRDALPELHAAAVGRRGGTSAPLAWLKATSQLGAQVANALAHVHACGIVHCDINLSNILIQHLAPGHLCPGEIEVCAKVSDFGISAVIPAGQSGAHAAQHGTVTHMPPELLTAPHFASPAADVWSLGVVVWELWTRAIAFDGQSTAAVVALVCEGRMPEWPKGTPPLLTRLVERCWALEPSDRPSALQIATTLREIVDILNQTEQGGRGGGVAGPTVATAAAVAGGAFARAASGGNVGLPPPPTGGAAAPLGPTSPFPRLVPVVSAAAAAAGRAAEADDAELEDTLLLDDALALRRVQRILNAPEDSRSGGGTGSSDSAGYAGLAARPRAGGGGGRDDGAEPRGGGADAFLWHMLRPPRAVDCARVEVAPLRTVWATACPALAADQR